MMLKILVCVKQVPACCEMSADGKDFTLNRSGTDMMCNPADERAFETALRLRDELRDGLKEGAEITLISMGKPGAARLLRDLSAIGGDRFYLISDPSFAGADTYATAEILRRAVVFLGDFDLILCGERSADGETGQVGPELAALLCRPFGTKETQYPLPAVVAIGRGCVLRSPGIMGLRRAEKTEITALSAKELGAGPKSLTRVIRMTREEVRKRRTVRYPPDEEGIGELIQAAGIRAFLSQNGKNMVGGESFGYGGRGI